MRLCDSWKLFQIVFAASDPYERLERFPSFNRHAPNICSYEHNVDTEQLSKMKWMAGFEPENSSVYARNEIAIDAAPERVWRWLIRAAKWPEWYSNSANVSFIRGNPPDLALDTEFRWKTFGATVTSRVIVFDHPHELGWDARGVLKAHHGWLIEPDGRGGCRVITEECQKGIVPKIAWWYLRPMLVRGHQDWVGSLKRVAEGGEPG
jgi:hypothetical protein